MTNFHCEATLHRFVRADDADAARRTAHQGLQLASGTLTDPYAVINTIEIDGDDVQEYRHRGESGDMWEVSVTVSAMVDTFDSHSAYEATRQLVSVNAADAAEDAFEFEVEVVGDPVAA